MSEKAERRPLTLGTQPDDFEAKWGGSQEPPPGLCFEAHWRSDNTSDISNLHGVPKMYER